MSTKKPIGLRPKINSFPNRDTLVTFLFSRYDSNNKTKSKNIKGEEEG